ECVCCCHHRYPGASQGPDGCFLNCRRAFPLLRPLSDICHVSVIRVQAFQFSIVNYVATALGAISTLWIYPLDFDAYGLAQFLVSMATLFIPIATLGTL